MRINYRYSATIDEVLEWARERLVAEIPGESLDQFLALVRAVRVGDEQYTVATLAKALRRDVGSVENDLDCLERVRCTLPAGHEGQHQESFEKIVEGRELETTVL